MATFSREERLGNGVRITPNAKNQTSVASLTEKATKAQSIVITDFSGTSVNQQVELRSKIREAGGEMVVAKNTLIDLAVGKGKLSDSLHGMNAAIFSYADPVGPVKVLFEFQKKNEKLTIKKGYMDDRVLSEDEVVALSKLPSKNELIAKLLMVLNSPATGMVNVLNAGTRNLVYALNAIAKKE